MSSFTLNYSPRFCRRKLRSLERLAYSSMVTSLRAQGSLTDEKKQLLKELQSVLHIPLPAHKAEIRRVVNSEVLHTIADRTEGPNTAYEWMIEGKRLVSVVPRVPIETEYTRYANEIVKAYKAQMKKQMAATKAKNTGPPQVIDLASDGSNWVTAQTDIEEIDLDIQNIVEPQITEESVPPKKDIRSRQKGGKRKCDPAEIDDSSRKKMAIAQPSEEFSDKQSFSEEIMEIPSTHDLISCPVPASNADDDDNSIQILKETPCEIEMISRSSRLQKFLPSKSLFASTSMPVLHANPIRKSAPKTTISSPSALIPDQLEISDSLLSATATPKPSKKLLTSDSFSCSVSDSVVNSVATPLLSVSVDDNLDTNAFSSYLNVTEAKAKPKTQPLSKKVLHPRLTRSDLNIGSPTMLNLPSTSQHPLSSTIHNWPKSVFSLKSELSSSSASSSLSSSSQVTSGSTIFQRPISPIKYPPKLGLSTTNTSKLQSPVNLKYCQTKTPASSNTESLLAELAKSFAKSSSNVSALATKTICQSPTSSKITTSDIITTWKPSDTPKILPPPNISGPLNMQQRLLTSRISTKSAPSISKHVKLGGEGALKIISGNTSNNIFSKSETSTSETAIVTTTGMITTTTSASTGLTKNAKIVNLTRPIKLDRGRFNLYSTPISASNNVSSFGVHGCSTPPVTTSSGRTVLPAKPNVIVVHKAKVLPQTSGAAIVMSPPSIFSQLSDEVKKDTIHSVPNKESGKQANATVKQKLFSVQSSHTMTSTVSKLSSFASTNTISLTAEQVLKEKKLERHPSIKLPGTAQAITLIERKIPGRLPVTSPEKLKFQFDKQQTQFLSTNTPLSSKIVTALPKETASSSKTKIECNLQQDKWTREGNSLIRRPLDADDNNPSKKLKLSLPVIDKPQPGIRSDSQEAMDILKRRERTRLSTKVLTILKQANIPVKEGKKVLPVDNKKSSRTGDFLQSTELMSDSFEEVTCQDDKSGSDLKFTPFTRSTKFKSSN